MKQDAGDLESPIVVWISEMSAARDSVPLLSSQLNPQEHARVARFKMQDDRARFVLGRALLHEWLFQYVPNLTGPIELAYTANGRPYFAQDTSIQFSITHTHDLVALAATVGGRVGIDLEFIRRDIKPLDLGRRVFSEHDFHLFQAIPEQERHKAFFRAWTRKEAYLKARGEGISAGLEQISVSFGIEPAGGLKDSRDETAEGIWRLHALPVADDYFGSLASDNGDKAIEFQPIRFVDGRAVPASPGQRL
jgi:4'-phosphopantetheinyl transferase